MASIMIGLDIKSSSPPGGTPPAGLQHLAADRMATTSAGHAV
jgi:hypothetical protein